MSTSSLLPPMTSIAITGTSAYTTNNSQHTSPTFPATMATHLPKPQQQQQPQGESSLEEQAEENAATKDTNVGLELHPDSSVEAPSSTTHTEHTEDTTGQSSSNGTEKPPVSKISRWFSSTWSKKNLGKAQKSMGDLLSRPGKIYRELKEESEVLRRRTEEIEQAMTVVVDERDKKKNRLAATLVGLPTHTCMQQIRAGDAADGILLGSSADEKLLTIKWQRRVLGSPSSTCQSLSPSGSNGSINGSLSPQTRVPSMASLSSEVSASTATESLPKEGWVNIPGSSTVKGLYQPSPDDIGCEIRAEIQFTRQFRLYSPTLLTDKVVYATCNYAALVVDEEVEEVVAGNVEEKTKEFTGVIDMFDPKKVALLKVELVQRGMKLCFTKTSQAETETESVHSSDTLTDEEQMEETAVFPTDAVRVQVVGENPSHVLINIRRGDDTSCSLILSAADSKKRDEIILTVRGMRAHVQAQLGLPELTADYDYDYSETEERRPVSRSSSEFFTGAKALGSSLMRSQQSSSSRVVDCRCTAKENEDTLIWLSSRGKTEGKEFCACTCIYPSVAAQAGVEVIETSSSLARPKRSFSDHGLLHFQSMSSLISNAFDPFALQSSGSKRSKRKYRGIYESANFAEPFDVVLDLEEGEGLGIQLGLFKVGKEDGIMCLTGFCAVDEKPGQLESHPNIAVGDALVAVNGNEVVEEGQRKGSLKRVVVLVNKARAPDAPAQEELINAKASISFTFAKPVKPSEGEENMQKELRSLREWKSKSVLESEKKDKEIKEVRGEVKAIKVKLVKADEKAETNSRKASEYCAMMEETKGAMALIKAEASIVDNERTILAEKMSQLRSGLTEEIEELKAKAVKAEDTADYWRVEAEKVGKEVIHREASMQALAMDGEAFSTALETKEKALRALEEDLNVLKVRNGTLQELLDSTRAERQAEEAKLGQFQKELAASKKAAEVANVEADKLTAKLLSQKEDYEEQLGRQAQELSEARESVTKLSSELCTSGTYSNALKDSMEALKERVKSLEKAKRQAEEETAQGRARCRDLEKKVREAVAEAESSQVLKQGSTAGERSESDSGASAQVASLEEEVRKLESCKAETETMVKHVQGVNDDLRAQVKSWKSKAQSMSGELSKIMRLSKLESEHEELQVKLKLMEATKMEAEDELSAYKRALVQFADQAKADERMGNGTPWTNRPRIFDHLYRKARKSHP